MALPVCICGHCAKIREALGLPEICRGCWNIEYQTHVRLQDDGCRFTHVEHRLAPLCQDRALALDAAELVAIRRCGAFEVLTTADLGDTKHLFYSARFLPVIRQRGYPRDHEYFRTLAEALTNEIANVIGKYGA